MSFTFKITVAYDGTDFVGWQRQRSGTSIQGLLEDALRELDQRDVTVTGAGRTDAGVHALGQVASFSIDRAMDAGALVGALTARLPATVRVLAADPVPSTFHARYGATSKTYRYRIWNGEVLDPFVRLYAWHLIGALDVDSMAEAARILEGRRDFAAFQAAGSSTTTTEREVFSSRIIETLSTTEDAEDTEAQSLEKPKMGLRVPRVLRGGELVEYEIRGDGFLRHMVRAIVGSLVEIGRGRRPVEWMAQVLASRDRAQGGPTAPAHGLTLVEVAYGDGRPGFLADRR